MTLVLLGIGASIVTGGAALPALLGGAAVLGGGAAGAKIGSDIEDKLTGKKEDQSIGEILIWQQFTKL